MAEVTPRILIVEDDADIADMLAEHFALVLGVDVSVARTAAEGLKLDLSHGHDVILADLKLPDGNGLDLARQLRDISDPQIVLMTGQPTTGQAIEGMRLGVRDLIGKPFDLTHLTATIRAVLDDHAKASARELRSRRLRVLSGRIIRERRHLRKRLDLLCRDLVEAYRNLADKVVDIHPELGQDVSGTTPTDSQIP